MLRSVASARLLQRSACCRRWHLWSHSPARGGSRGIEHRTRPNVSVVYKDGTSSANAASLVEAQADAVVYNYDQIGVAVAKSNHTTHDPK